MFRKFVFLTIIAGLISFSQGSFVAVLHAEEPFEAYLEALAERGYTDVAVRYLERMADSSLVAPEFKSDSEYQKGRVLVAAARKTTNSQLRQQQLDRAQQSFDRFLKSQPQHPSVALARNQLGNILVERARSLATRASKDKTGRSKELAQQSYAVYEEAFDALSESKTEIGKNYTKLAQQRDPESRRQLKQVKTQYIQTYLAIGRILFEQAKTIEDDGKRYRDKLAAAAKAFDEVATKYRSVSAGLYATLYEGECYQLLGEHQRALSYFKELLQSQDNSPAVRRLKTSALARSIESWLENDPQQGPNRSIQLAQEWITKRRSGDERQAAWMDFQLALAKAYHAQSKIAQGDKQADRALTQARDIARELAKRKSQVQSDAQQLLVALGSGDQPAQPTAPEDANTFAEARDAAKSALDSMKLATTTVAILSSQLKQVRNPQRRQEIEERLSEAKTQVTNQSENTLSLFQRAQSLATAEDAEGLTTVRYYLSYLYYTMEDYRRAAVLAGHTALRYPDSVAAKECASVALAARQRLYQQASELDRQAHTDAIAKIGELLVSKWPNDRKANAALTTLLDVAIARGDLQQAEQYLDRIPADSPKRAAAELRFGQNLWREFLRRRLDNESPNNTAAEHEALKKRAQEMLRTGLDRSAGQPATESAVRGALSLAKIYVDAGQPEDALDLLQQDDIGGLYLSESNSPWLQKIPGLSTDGYTTAIRAYIASAATSSDSARAIHKAQQLLDGLRSELQNQPDGAKKTIGIYVSLARDLERQLAVAPPASQPALSQGFEAFLEKAAEGSDDVAVLNWVAETLYGMGKGLIQGTKTSPQAQRYFTKAATAYQQVLDAVQQRPDALPSSTVQQIRVRQAMTLRQIGRYEQAIDLFAIVLGKNRFLNIQVEAAKTLQQWGQSGNEEALLQAIMGARPAKNGKNLIWGWGRIAKLVAKAEEHRDTFHDARYNIARSRFELAKKKSNAEKNKLLAQAKSDLKSTRQLYGLGNPDQSKRSETLLRAVQKSLGERQNGFEKK